MPISRVNISELKTLFAGDPLILVPNNRIRIALLDEYSRLQKANVFFSPSIMGIDIWLEDLWLKLGRKGISPFCDYQILSPVDEKLLWLQILENSLDKYPLLNSAEAASSVSHGYRLLRQWQANIDSIPSLSGFLSIPDVSAFSSWITEYRESCETHKVLNLVDCIHKLLKAHPRLDPAWLPNDIKLFNFFEPPPIYSALFEKLSEQKDCESLFSKQSGIRSNRQRFSFHSLDEESQACSTWIDHVVKQDPHAHIGVISNKGINNDRKIRGNLEKKLDPAAILQLGTLQSAVNHSQSGMPIIQTAVIADALLLLGLFFDIQKSENICRILQSNHLIAAEEEQEARLQMELFMRRFASSEYSLSELNRHLGNEEKPYYAPILSNTLLQYKTHFRANSQPKITSEWVAFIEESLQEFGWPGEYLTDTEKSIVRQWHELIEQVASSGIYLGQVQFQSILGKVKLLCGDMLQKYPTNTKAQVSLLTPNEAIGLNFDYVWFLGFDHKSWPTPIAPSPFIPYSIQEELGMPGCNSTQNYEQAQQTFKLICNSTNTEIIISHHMDNEELHFRSSGLAADIPISECRLIKDQSEPIRSLIDNFSVAPTITKIVDENIPLSEEEIIDGGHKIISDQSSCPFRSFANHRLKARSLNDFETGMNPMARGTATHKALELLFEKITSLEQIQLINEAQRNYYLDEASQQAIDYLSDRFPQFMTPNFSRIEKQRIKTLLLNFLEMEKSRNDFTVLVREHSQKWQHGKLNINLQIDRIDQLNDESLALIDYKTGKTSYPRKAFVEERPEDMQLPVYYTATRDINEQQVSSVNIAHLNTENFSYSGISAEPNFQSKTAVWDSEKEQMSWKQLTDGWVEKTKSLADEFTNGTALVNPSNQLSTCKYCNLNNLCRIKEVATKNYSMPNDEAYDD
jgi:ATP-dependent helicase/nuclease subunit B